MKKHISEHKSVGPVIVTKHSIAGTNAIVYSVYEISSYFGPHSTLFTIDGETCGSLPSRRLPKEIQAIPVGPARFEACDAFRKANEEEAYKAILVAYPEAAEGTRSNGEIEVWT